MIFVCFNYSTSFSSDEFPSFKNSAKEARLLRNDILSLKINRPDLQTFTYCIKKRSKSCESQARSPPHRFTGKTTNLSDWNPREKGRRLDVLVLFVKQSTLVKSGAVHSG